MKIKIQSIVKSKKIAAMISYAATVLSAAASIVLIPVCLRYVGSDQYGLYQKIYAVVQYLMIIDLGLGSTVVRFAVSAKTRRDVTQEQRINGFMLKVSIGLNCVIAVLGVLMYLYIDVIYNTMQAAELIKARQLLIIMILHSVLAVFQDYLGGIVETHEHFVFSKSKRLFRMGSRVVLIPLLIAKTRDIAVIAYVDLALITITVLATIFYDFCVLNARLSFQPVGRTIAKSASTLMLACLLQNTSKFLNNGIDKILLGRYLGNGAVTTYSVAMTFISFFMIASTVIQSVHLPQIVRMNTQGASIEKLTDVVVRVGRIQMALCGGFLCGFIILGKEFINIWAGAGHDEAWYIALIIMVPLIVPLTQNVCLSILTAKDKRLFRAVVIVCLSITNMLLTIFLVKRIGLMGAPIGTAAAYLLGNVIAMNVYYSKALGIRVVNMFRRIGNKIVPSIVLSGVICFFLFKLFPVTNQLWPWVGKALIFLACYGAMLLAYGFNESEKKALLMIKKKLIR